MRIRSAPARSAARAASASPLNVQKPSPWARFAWWRPLDSDPATPPLASAANAAATAPPFEARTIDHRPGSQAKPFEPASERGSPVRTAVTYAGSWTAATSASSSGAGSTRRTPAIGRSARESATQRDFRVVSNSCSDRT